MPVPRLAKRANLLPLLLLLSFSVWILNSLSKSWFGGRYSGSLGWICLAVFIATIVLYPLPIMWMKRRAVAAATRATMTKRCGSAANGFGQRPMAPNFKDGSC